MGGGAIVRSDKQTRRHGSRYTKIIAGLAWVAVSGCGVDGSQANKQGVGTSPRLPTPRYEFIPTIHIAKVQGWSAGQTPHTAAGLRVSAFARDLVHPRWLYVLKNGDVLVAETNAPRRPDDKRGLKGWIMRMAMARAGADVPSPDRITLLRDSDGDGVADQRWVLLSGLSSPFGMAQVADELFVANTDAVVKFPFSEGDTHIPGEGATLVKLPGGPINHHWTKNLIVNAQSTKLYVTVGSNSNVAERGMAVEAGRAAIWEVDIASGAHRVFASGLRNPNGLAWEHDTGALWTVVNERDGVGDDLVPDFLTSVRDGGFYGWPYSYFGRNRDKRVKPARPDLEATAIVPDYALGSHTASLGLVSSAGTSLSSTFADGMFVGQHGSWNRTTFSGYKVVFVPFRDGMPSGAPPIDVLTGFLTDEGAALGRPVGVATDRKGALLVADDVGNVIWRVTTRP
jgi:glucose/arabinose dehydrogenase